MIPAVRLLNLRRIRRQPLRAVLAVVAVTAGVSLAVSVVVLTTSISRSITDFGRRLGGPAPLRVVGAASRAGLDEAVLGKVETTPGVGAAVPVVQAVTFAQGRHHEFPVLVLGVDCRMEVLVGPFGCVPDRIAAARDTDPPIVAPSLARRLGPTGVVRNDLGSSAVKDAPTAVALDRVNAGAVVVYPLPVAQRLFGRAHRLDAIYVRPAPGVRVDELRPRLTAAVGRWNGVLGASDPPPGIDLASGIFVPIFSLMSLLALGVGGVLVYNVLSLSLEERRRDLAVVGALGAPGATVVGGALVEAGLLGLVGGVLGIPGGVALAHPLSHALSEFTARFAGLRIDVHHTPTARARSRIASARFPICRSRRKITTTKRMTAAPTSARSSATNSSCRLI